MIQRRKDLLPLAVWRLHTAFAAAGILLNFGWFALLLKGGAGGERRAGSATGR